MAQAGTKSLLQTVSMNLQFGVFDEGHRQQFWGSVRTQWRLSNEVRWGPTESKPGMPRDPLGAVGMYSEKGRIVRLHGKVCREKGK